MKVRGSWCGCCATSITQPHLNVDDLGMGRTAIASPRHWVGYAAVGFR